VTSILSPTPLSVSRKPSRLDSVAVASRPQRAESS
jgi:hypothetical protein